MLPVVTRRHVCELCEAGCGLLVEIEEGRAVRIRPDDDDVFSRGFACPKGLALPSLDADPDRLRQPVRRDPDGSFRPIGWDEAFAFAADRLRAVQRRHGRDSVATYFGTPWVHKHGSLLMHGALIGALRTRNATGASSQDTSPRLAASYFLYGSTLSVPIPDVDRTDYFLCVGANPVVSNGSQLTAPDMRGRMRAIRQRGGKVVVIDPRRTETAREASEHVPILPGGDAGLLLAMTQVLVEEGRVDRAWIERHTRGWNTVADRIRSFTPERAETLAGVPAATIRRLAREFAAAPSSAAYGRLGVCCTEFGTLASYAVDLLNVAAGRLGVAGGSMFATPAIDLPRLARLIGTDGYARWRSRVRGLPETAGELPATTLAEEMETAGQGQVRALVTFGGNPVLTTPNGRRLAGALARLDAMVSIDMYVNETTRFADVILPPCGLLSDDHVDFFFANFAARNVIRWVPAAIPRSTEERSDWEILLELSHRLGGGPTGIRVVDAALRLARRFGWVLTPDRIADLALRIGPYGVRPGRRGLDAAKVRAAEHGIDLGPLREGIEHRVFHRHGRVEVAPQPILGALGALERALDHRRDPEQLSLIGRRDLRSNNSWMHNLPRLVSGNPRCTLFVHPVDAARLGLRDGGAAVLESKVHRGEVPVRVTDEVRPGVVSLPHGWGHGAAAPWQSVAGANAGVSANDWTDDQSVESLVGQSILNGVPVRLHPVESAGANGRASTRTPAPG